ATLAQRAEIRESSPVLEVDVAIDGAREPLRVLGLDTFRAARLQPQLTGDIAGDYLGLFGADTIWLSDAAARELGVARGDRIVALVGTTRRELIVRGLLPKERYGGRLGLMDIATAQWALDRVGRISRIDLQLVPGVDVDAFAGSLSRTLPAGLQTSTPELEADRAASLTRAYRVNLAMLALVSILTGALLLFATQSLSVLRRRTSLALLRALGVTRGSVRNALLAEGLVLGAIGSLIGIVLGLALASTLLALFRGSLGIETGGGFAASLVVRPLPLIGFFLLGTVAAGLGAWVPALEAARRPPARALKAGDAELAVSPKRFTPFALVLLAGALVLALLPPVGGLPVFGYASIAALLAGGLLLVPTITARLVALAPSSGRPALDVGLAQIRGGVGQLSVSLAAVIVSFALMVAMAIMVHSFRDSFDRWLGDALPADIRLRVVGGNETRRIDDAAQRALGGIDGVERVAFRRQLQVLLRAGREPVALLAVDDFSELSRMGTDAVAEATLPRAYVSEAIGDLYGLRAGEGLKLPLQTASGPRDTEFHIAGVFRDYGRSTGAIAIERSVYTRITGDTSATDAAIWLAPRVDAEIVEDRLRRVLGDDGATEMRRSTEIRELSMRAFDRAFTVTYALERTHRQFADLRRAAHLGRAVVAEDPA
ncbi:FtsX-like permease family protein, partial [bacterium]